MGKAPTKSRRQEGRIQRETPGPRALDGADVLVGAIAFVVPFAAYLCTLCPTIYESGAGENVTAVATLGVPHPPGFPLFCLLGKSFTLLVPLGSVAWRVNLFSASCGALASCGLFLVARGVLGDSGRVASLAAALLFAFSRTFWSQAVIAEVYTLNALVLTGALLSLLGWDRGGPLWPVGLLSGLGLAVHPLHALFFPGFILWLATSPRRAEVIPRIHHLLFAGIAGTSLHLYAPIRSRANPLLDWGNPESLRSLLPYATAAQYRGRMFHQGLTAIGANVHGALHQLAFEITPWLLPLPLFGAAILWRKNRRLLAATAIPALLTFVYAVNYDIPWEIDVYYIPVVFVLCLWSAWALACAPQLARRLGPLVAGIAFLPLIGNWHACDRSTNDVFLSYARDLLRACPEAATLVLPETDATFGVLYLIAVERQRPDLHVWITVPPGVKPLDRALDPDVVPTALATLVARTQGPLLHAEKLSPDAVLGRAFVPDGVAYRIVARDRPPPSVHGIEDAEILHDVDPLPAFALSERARIVLAHVACSRGDHAAARGHEDEARASYERALAIGPGIADVEREVGFRLADLGDVAGAVQHVARSLALRDDAVVENRLGHLLIQAGRNDEALASFQRALTLDPDLAIAHSNLGALLGMKGDLAAALDHLKTAVRLDPQSTLAHNNLARAYLLRGDPVHAAEELLASLALDPDQDQVRHQIEMLR